MIWTTALPDKTGWYWYQPTYSDPECVFLNVGHVYRTTKEGPVTLPVRWMGRTAGPSGYARTAEVLEGVGRWAGPIPEPIEKP